MTNRVEKVRRISKGIKEKLISLVTKQNYRIKKVKIKVFRQVVFSTSVIAQARKFFPASELSSERNTVRRTLKSSRLKLAVTASCHRNARINVRSM